MWCWIELVMASFKRKGIRTCRTSPTKEATSEVMKMPLWAPHDGHDPAEPGEGLVGVDGGPGRLVAGHLGDGDERGVRPRGWPADGAASRGASSAGTPGQPVGAERVPPGHQAVEGAFGFGRIAEAARRSPPVGRRRRRRPRRAPVGRCRSGRGPPGGGRRPHGGVRPGPGRPGRRRWRSRSAGGRPDARPGRRRRRSFSSRSPSTRYCGAERSAVARPISTCLASQAAVRPRV